MACEARAQAAEKIMSNDCSILIDSYDGSEVYRYPAITGGVIVSGKVLTTVTSTLSIFGIALILFTYIAYKDLRTRARAMVCHLSIADFIVVVSQMVGIYANYERFLLSPNASNMSSEAQDKLCISQAAFTTFGTIGSFLWSNAIGLYMVVLFISARQRVHQVLYYSTCVICWLVPTLVVVCLASMKYFGFVTVGSPGCYVTNIPSKGKSTLSIRVAEIFSYELWLYLTFLLLPCLYGILFYHTRCRSKHSSTRSSVKSMVDIKLLLIPLVFLLLRVWSAVIGVLIFFTSDEKYKCSTMAAVFIIIEEIALNAQGLANAILFCALTPSVRRSLWYSLTKWNRNKYESIFQEETSPIVNGSSLLYTGSHGSVN